MANLPFNHGTDEYEQDNCPVKKCSRNKQTISCQKLISFMFCSSKYMPQVEIVNEQSRADGRC